MISLLSDGFAEVQEWLAEQMALVQSDALWDPVTHSAAEEVLRYVISISPVVTGAYRSAHTIIQERMGATVAVDPKVRNPRTGTPVIRYAAAVEEKHHIYERAYTESRAAVTGAEELMERLGA